MQRYGQNRPKMPPKWGFSPICDPYDFLKNRALSLLHPYNALTSYKKVEKNNGLSLRYLRRTDNGQTDGPMDRDGYVGPLLINWDPKIISLVHLNLTSKWEIKQMEVFQGSKIGDNQYVSIHIINYIYI